MATFKTFEEIHAWQKARELNMLVGNFIDSGRFKSNFRLINQIEGSAGSIMDNIAEGFERSGNKEFLQFLYIAKGSCGEFRSQLYRATDRNYIQKPEFDELFALSKEIINWLQKLIDYLQTSELKGTKYMTRKEDNK
ncbi:four helix bundle protein [Flavisolibacter ginsenosidimutans]|uniref:Four helix bundle protein n=1 Tax=Flavisolibacter ginsenosidimutans TaxID=661481 RepID=A0A5B8UDG1_9BACT|nr:four helix bundle protein [Flavisolibacter ginsenosidimutans]QEC54548.1 four helix bundle protein [Flavisolibacter ginsenosidimutans]